MTESLSLRLAARHDLTAEICEFTFVAANGGPLPGFDAGAHLTVETPSGPWRSYSLSNDDSETDRYIIAVKREETGRGGSLSMHLGLSVGDIIAARAAKNAFELAVNAPTLLIAGGIGITPMLAMLRRFAAHQHLPGRSRGTTAIVAPANQALDGSRTRWAQPINSAHRSTCCGNPCRNGWWTGPFASSIARPPEANFASTTAEYPPPFARIFFSEELS